MEASAADSEGIQRAAVMKPMTSPVNWALLGLVMERPGYGYKLMMRFEHAYGDVLPLGSESHIYTALNELRRRRLIEEVPETEASRTGISRQPRPRYRATAAGVRSYREWMLARVSEDRRQSRLFVRQLAVFGREPEVALQILERYENECLQESTHAPRATIDRAGAGSASELADQLVYEESRLALEARLPWVEYARNVFKSL